MLINDANVTKSKYCSRRQHNGYPPPTSSRRAEDISGSGHCDRGLTLTNDEKLILRPQIGCARSSGVCSRRDGHSKASHTCVPHVVILSRVDGRAADHELIVAQPPGNPLRPEDVRI
ncbi:hypothetical protein GWI33_006583 [Rhynchophorus ferrugineus]|uniref:Uncharacterized protein n=1 Tax=Rhynchophorus ferrugineus TaxID=354439 RepID=A0A834IUD3_RHYFE|nr:hypothetical protein GWI33_006583 [Rhynchophorus ferrugineus]